MTCLIEPCHCVQSADRRSTGTDGLPTRLKLSNPRLKIRKIGDGIGCNCSRGREIEVAPIEVYPFIGLLTLDHECQRFNLGHIYFVKLIDGDLPSFLRGRNPGQTDCILHAVRIGCFEKSFRHTRPSIIQTQDNPIEKGLIQIDSFDL